MYLLDLSFVLPIICIISQYLLSIIKLTICYVSVFEHEWFCCRKGEIATQLFPPESHTIHVILEDLFTEVKINEEVKDLTKEQIRKLLKTVLYVSAQNSDSAWWGYKIKYGIN